jgi:hypothetical protein
VTLPSKHETAEPKRRPAVIEAQLRHVPAEGKFYARAGSGQRREVGS